ncbi:MAG: hypothetical protein A2Z47_09110 [Thermodesulfovibrio sp. RBG_19FT_COMBO_42_12]|nr:MAG: hypothetical protein A2Z47_09110 [Thermodesulfovibrio sp. RBG_19FT_COMBO_42_12]
MKKSYFLLITLCSLLFAVFLWGCGEGPGSPGSEGSEDTGVEVTITNVTHQYLDQDIAWQIDIYPIADCDGKPETVDPELFSDDFAIFDFEGTPLNPNATITPGDLHVETYSVEFFAKDPGSPPIERYDGFQRFTIPADGSITGVQIFIIDADRKIETSNLITAGIYIPQRMPMQYDMKITFNGQNDYGEDFKEEYLTTVEMADYDHCE